jgi:hypothetical protein
MQRLPVPTIRRHDEPCPATHTSETNSPARSARQVAREYLKRYPKDRYDTVVESWADIQSYNIEFVMKRLREPRKA